MNCYTESVKISTEQADTSFWLANTFANHVFHRAAREWFASQSANGSVLFCRSTQQSFLRLLTTEATTRPHGIPSISNAAAWKLYESIRSEKRVAFAIEPAAEKIEPLWRSFAARQTQSPKLWMDAYLAAFAIAGGHQLVTTDKAFGQFNGLDAIVIVGGGART